MLWFPVHDAEKKKERRRYAPLILTGNRSRRNASGAPSFPIAPFWLFFKRALKMMSRSDSLKGRNSDSFRLLYIFSI